MQRKDFKLIADALRGNRPSTPILERDDSVKIGQWRATVIALATALATTNPRFDEGRFLDAAGFHLPTRAV